MKTIASQFIYYLIAGAIAFSIDLSCFSILRYYLQLNISGANISARFLGALSAYLMNHFWTFKANNSISLSFLKYAALWVCSTFISTQAILLASHYRYGLNAEVASKFCIEILIVLFNFILCKYWVFKKIPPQ